MTAQKDLATRDRIVHAAARLLSEANGEPVSTRAVCTAAGVGAPTLYHHFGDKQGLFDAVAAYGFDEYLASKRAQGTTGDPVDDLRRGWDLHVEYGVTHPAFYTLMYGTSRTPAAAKEADAILLGLIEAVARAGRLRVAVETAARVIHAAGVGVTLTLIAAPAGEEGDRETSVRTREAVLAAVTVPPDAAPLADAVALKAAALKAALAAAPPPALSASETALLNEWLDRLAG
ncbi:TetR/AcrR family transcriptional regulator [Actinomadura madurae]|uniref:TetR/AcrR family transcriptional regulator n=1 Tax=Actinomadura madurae TaxID=1993 RepID=UPI0020276AF8|nr:TetR/AcrR family transcriptional regulator [Actinomadura madurae]MCP9965570.1 TetR/AcrR family transcriptional regulator [Actinomadura madurae]MCP9978052.1 TetR/AcrR family transcriptional regulator [Actinomadura madurae]MCQ0014245.1 TetR/AcrR family transcriptional regulator [Actinomadura madurae]URM94408.1 TetR/AcrR family transcriptional regulator [Actinomadura madurae]URN05115.1 TetR/AcrR family transcriptional regulator [Actinomadura madurae]